MTLDKIYHAAFVLKDIIRKTDVIAAPELNPDADIILKTENLQVTGSFKVRGAAYKISQLSDEEKAIPEKHYMEYPELHDTYIEMIRRTVEKYKNDDRIFCWNIYNEPGISLDGELAMSILTELFDLVRSLDPIQPLCSDIWHTTKDGVPATPEERLSLELSDIISYHCYGDYVKQVFEIHALQKYNRPIFQTEWLHRINHNTVQEVYPLFYITNVANYCWGFVVEKTQTNEPWDVMWEWLDNGDPKTANYDFTKWQHDLFRPNLRPYDPNEIALIKRFNDKAKKEGR